MQKKWIKFLKDHKTFKANQIEQVDETAAELYVETGIAEVSAEPAGATKQAGDLADKLTKTIEDRVAAGVQSATDQIVGLLDAKLKSAPGRRPHIVVGPDRELEDPTDGFKSFGDYLGAVRKSCSNQGTDERLTRRAKANGASENVNADGGYTVPVQYAEGIFSDIALQNSLMSQCYRIPMSGNSIRIPALNYTQQGDFGVTALWEGEGVAIPPTKAKFRQPQLTLNKLAVLVPVTNELLEDSPATEQIVSTLASEAITYKLNDAIFNGTGSGMPTGIIGHASAVSLTRNTASHFKAQDAIGMKARFLSPLGRAGKFYANQDVDPDLYTIQDPSGRYLYFAPGTFGESPNGRLLGAEHVPTINCQSLGTTGDVVYADLSQYAFGYKTTGVNKAMSIHLYFATDETAYRWTFRCDGRPLRDTTLKAAKGTATYSPFVVLN